MYTFFSQSPERLQNFGRVDELIISGTIFAEREREREREK
jgi:hypothetical protein